MEKKIDIKEHKIMTMEEKKRECVINAAMAEFCNGYKNASTDVIVREAGISKGLLFHYFGTKEGLYEFIVWYAFNIMIKEYFDLINTKQGDLLENLWQITLLKMDLSYKYPAIFEFLTSAYIHSMEEPENGFALQIKTMQEQVVSGIYKNADTSLFKDGIDVKKAYNIIYWTLTGYSQTQMKAGEKLDYYQREYERYLAEVKEYFDIFRKILYK